MGELKSAIDQKNREIAELNEKRAEIERNYENNPRFDRMKRSLLLPLQEQMTRLGLEVRAIETSFEYSQELEIEAMAAQRAAERALEQRRAERASRKEAERTQYDQEIAGWSWELSGIADKPRIVGGKAFLTDQHRAIGRKFAAALVGQREKAMLMQSAEGLAAIAETAERYGISVAQAQDALGLDAPADFMEATVEVDGVFFDIVQDAQGVFVERNSLRTIDAAMSGDSDGGSE